MKIKIIAFILFFMATGLFAQNKGRLEIGALLSPAFSNWRYKINSLKESFDYRLFLSGRLQGRYFIGERLAARLGFGYLRQGNSYEVRFPINQPEATNYKTVYRVQSLNLPIGADYLLAKGDKLNFSVGFDFNTIYFLKNEAEILSLPEGDENKYLETGPVDDFTFALTPHLQFDFAFNDKLKLLVSPVFSHQVWLKKQKFKSYFYSYGLDVGVLLKI